MQINSVLQTSQPTRPRHPHFSTSISVESEKIYNKHKCPAPELCLAFNGEMWSMDLKNVSDVYHQDLSVSASYSVLVREMTA